MNIGIAIDTQLLPARRDFWPQAQAINLQAPNKNINIRQYVGILGRIQIGKLQDIRIRRDGTVDRNAVDQQITRAPNKVSDRDDEEHATRIAQLEVGHPQLAEDRTFDLLDLDAQTIVERQLPNLRHDKTMAEWLIQHEQCANRQCDQQDQTGQQYPDAACRNRKIAQYARRGHQNA
ncbi:MAG: hypothetical protein ACRCUI_08825 [Polymorphobacter sp.]